MEKMYRHWDSKGEVEKFSSSRPWAKRFRSEVFFLETIMRPGMSVLDVGCATGELYHGLKERYGAVRYVGMDIAPHMIACARQFAHGSDAATFIAGNILDSDENLKGEQFDVVTATGVFQHEPNYEKLFEKMIAHTKIGGHLLFDVKLFHSHPALRDITQAYCDYPDPLYYIILTMPDLLALLARPGVENEAAIYGYYSGVHSAVRLPASVKEEVLSAHVLVRRTDAERKGEYNFSLRLPEEFIRHCFKET
mgnify:CR=1 FL=1